MTIFSIASVSGDIKTKRVGLNPVTCLFLSVQQQSSTTKEVSHNAHGSTDAPGMYRKYYTWVSYNNSFTSQWMGRQLFGLMAPSLAETIVGFIRRRSDAHSLMLCHRHCATPLLFRPPCYYSPSEDRASFNTARSSHFFLFSSERDLIPRSGYPVRIKGILYNKEGNNTEKNA